MNRRTFAGAAVASIPVGFHQDAGQVADASKRPNAHLTHLVIENLVTQTAPIDVYSTVMPIKGETLRTVEGDFLVKFVVHDLSDPERPRVIVTVGDRFP